MFAMKPSMEQTIVDRETEINHSAAKMFPAKGSVKWPNQVPMKRVDIIRVDETACPSSMRDLLRSREQNRCRFRC